MSISESEETVNSELIDITKFSDKFSGKPTRKPTRFEIPKAYYLDISKANISLFGGGSPAIIAGKQSAMTAILYQHTFGRIQRYEGDPNNPHYLGDVCLIELSRRYIRAITGQQASESSIGRALKLLGLEDVLIPATPEIDSAYGVESIRPRTGFSPVGTRFYAISYLIDMMFVLNKENIEEIRKNVGNREGLVFYPTEEAYGGHKKEGGHAGQMLCPCHDDHHPSGTFYLNKERTEGAGHCWSCLVRFRVTRDCDGKHRLYPSRSDEHRTDAGTANKSPIDSPTIDDLSSTIIVTSTDRTAVIEANDGTLATHEQSNEQTKEPEATPSMTVMPCMEGALLELPLATVEHGPKQVMVTLTGIDTDRHGVLIRSRGLSRLSSETIYETLIERDRRACSDREVSKHHTAMVDRGEGRTPYIKERYWSGTRQTIRFDKGERRTKSISTYGQSDVMFDIDKIELPEGKIIGDYWSFFSELGKEIAKGIDLSGEHSVIETSDTGIQMCFRLRRHYRDARAFCEHPKHQAWHVYMRQRIMDALKEVGIKCYVDPSSSDVGRLYRLPGWREKRIRANTHTNTVSVEYKLMRVKLISVSTVSKFATR